MSTSIHLATIAGFDPSGGAGILADIKTFAALGFEACGVITANTLQTHHSFLRLSWTDEQEMLEQLVLILKTYPINHLKIGLVKDAHQLGKIIDCIYRYVANPFIVWDPVLSSSTGFVFHQGWKNDFDCLNRISVITPNAIEFAKLWPQGIDGFRGEMRFAIYLKGGHRVDKKGTDTLFWANESIDLCGQPFPKVDRHGSGCVFASALTAYHLSGLELIEAARKAKQFTEAYLLEQKISATTN
mgnify:CR=1 FL=1